MKVLIGQIYWQKDLSFQMRDMIVDKNNKINIAMPVVRGFTTKAVESVPVMRKKNSRIHPLFNFSGHYKFNP